MFIVCFSFVSFASGPLAAMVEGDPDHLLRFSIVLCVGFAAGVAFCALAFVACWFACGKEKKKEKTFEKLERNLARVALIRVALKSLLMEGSGFVCAPTGSKFHLPGCSYLGHLRTPQHLVCCQSCFKTIEAQFLEDIAEVCP